MNAAERSARMLATLSPHQMDAVRRALGMEEFMHDVRRNLASVARKGRKHWGSLDRTDPKAWAMLSGLTWQICAAVLAEGELK